LWVINRNPENSNLIESGNNSWDQIVRIQVGETSYLFHCEWNYTYVLGYFKVGGNQLPVTHNSEYCDILAKAKCLSQKCVFSFKGGVSAS